MAVTNTIILPKTIGKEDFVNSFSEFILFVNP